MNQKIMYYFYISTNTCGPGKGGTSTVNLLLEYLTSLRGLGVPS